MQLSVMTTTGLIHHISQLISSNCPSVVMSVEMSLLNWTSYVVELLFFIKWSALLQLLTGNQGGSLGNMMEGEEEVGEAAAIDTFVR